MTDSIASLDSEGHRHGVYQSTGRLHKGHAVVAQNSSIPTKYQTIVVSNAEHRGFNSQAKRFQYESQENVHPGPGTYGVKKDDFVNRSPSLSKKGTGGFASKRTPRSPEGDKRRAIRAPGLANPGANQYALPSMLRTQRDFNKSTTTSSFSKPIAVHREKGQDRPAPNEYDVLRAKVSKENNVTAAAAFKSHTRRDFIDLKEANSRPGPGQYDVEEGSLLCRPAERAVVSVFRSTARRQPLHQPNAVPGPGTYGPGESVEDVKKLLMPKKHYLCLSAPALQLPPTPPGPGPGAYEMVRYEDPKHFMSGSVFLSNTSRWATGGALNMSRSKLPGPAHYCPTRLDKQSFLYNAQNKWVV